MVTLVIGGGKHTWDEVDRAFDEFHIDKVVAVNQAIVDYAGKVDAAVSLHPSKLQGWLDERKITPAKRVVSFMRQRGTHQYPVTDVVPYLWWGMTKSGSSGLYAVKVAMQLLGADKIILAGVPMDGGPHYYNDRMWGTPKDFREGWMQALPYIKDSVRSYRSWTKDLLGKPTKDWAT